MTVIGPLRWTTSVRSIPVSCPFLGKRPQHPFLLEIEADRGRTAVDVLGILGRVDRSQTLVQLGERVRLRRDQMLAAV